MYFFFPTYFIHTLNKQTINTHLQYKHQEITCAEFVYINFSKHLIQIHSYKTMFISKKFIDNQQYTHFYFQDINILSHHTRQTNMVQTMIIHDRYNSTKTDHSFITDKILPKLWFFRAEKHSLWHFMSDRHNHDYHHS